MQWGLEKWADPWAHPYDSPYTKQYDYVAFSFVSSLFGEHIIYNPPINYSWVILWIHLFFYLFAIRETFISKLPSIKLAGLFILFTHLTHLTQIMRLNTIRGCFLDYRFVGWSCIAWAILYASALSKSNNLFSSLLCMLAAIGIIIQVYTLLIISGANY